MKYKVVFVYVLCFGILIVNTVHAYEFVNPSNETEVKQLRDDIYQLKETYDIFFDEIEEEEEIVYEQASDTSNLYWWPIGSEETTTVDGKEFALGDPEETLISSTFGRRKLNEESEETSHYAIDIANYRGVGVTNVIAAKSGTVVLSSADEGDNCPTISLETLNTPEAQCGGGFGNFVIIQHSDGMFTIYAHLHKNSIKVKTGENVERGQVIGKMGSSGFSTGSHLHFEMRLGENNSSSAVDPLEYVDKDNPRPNVGSSVSGSAISIAREMIDTREGVGCMGKPSIDGDYYIACYGGDGVTTIGHGVTFENNVSSFQARGYNSLVEGDKVPISVIDEIEEEILQRDHGDAVYKFLAEAGIDDLKEYQIAALISRSYNNGTCLVYDKYCPDDYPDFVTAYLKYKGKYDVNEMKQRQDGIWSESMSEYIRSYSTVLAGLQKRRVWEWVMFCTGELIDFDSIDPDEYVWY